MQKHVPISFLLLFFCLNSFQMQAQTTLAAGEVAIIRMNTTFIDGFAFVLLRALDADTKIYFTEQGWRGVAGVFQTNGEAHVEWTAPAGGLPAGTVVTVNENFLAPNTFSTSTGTTILISGDFDLSDDGDQMIAYQGTEASPTFLFAVQSNSTNWQTNPNDPNQSSLPAGLINGTTAVAIGKSGAAEDEYDNIEYNTNNGTSGSAADLLALIANANSWNARDFFRFTSAIPNFTLTSFPVEWLSFDAEVRGPFVALEWATASELNNDFFAVERSVDGLAYMQVGKVQGAGTTQDIQTYHFSDLAPITGPSYYRLRQVDYDGAFDFSDVIRVEMTEAGNQVRMYPNPVVDYLHVESRAGTLRLYTLAGQQLLNLQIEAGITRIDLSGLQTGLYFAEILGQDQSRSTHRILK